MTVDIVTWNVHGLPRPFDLHFLPWDRTPRHHERVRNVLARITALSLMPDILAFQEVWRDDDAAAITSFPGYTFCKVANGPLMRPTGLLTGVRRDKWSITSHETLRYRHAAGTDTLGKKGALLVTLRSCEDASLVFINTHLQAQSAKHGPRTYSAIRISQIDELTRFASGVARPGVPVIAAGDFNTYPYPSDASAYERLSNGRPWLDLTRAARANCGCETNFAPLGKGRMDGWIDYCLAFADPSLRFHADIDLLRNTRIDTPFSDHQGLTARIAISAVSSSLPVELAALHFCGRAATRREWLAAVALTLATPVRALSPGRP